MGRRVATLGIVVGAVAAACSHQGSPTDKNVVARGAEDVAADARRVVATDARLAALLAPSDAGFMAEPERGGFASRGHRAALHGTAQLAALAPERVGGGCVPDQGATCDGNTLVSVTGPRKPCAPYTCEGAACRTACVTVSDCVAPAVCNEVGQCVAFPESVTTGEGGGCSTTRTRGENASSVCLTSALIVFARARRRRD